MYRDFSDKSKQNLLSLVNEIENEKWSDFTDWVGDRWYDFGSWIGTLNVKHYIDNVNSYHKKVLDKNNTTKKAIEKIFSEVKGVDRTYGDIFGNVTDVLSGWLDYVEQLSEIVTPANGMFSAQYMSAKLNPILTEIKQEDMDCLRDKMVQNINGELFFDEDLIYSYMKKSPAEMTDAEQTVLLEVISQLKDTVAIYETLSSIGTDEIGAEFHNYVSWVADSEEYESFAAVSAHYNKIYVNLLNYMVEQSAEEKTFAASLAKIGINESVLTLLGAETSENLKDIFGSDSLKLYVAKYVSEHSTQYFQKLELSEKDSLSGPDSNKHMEDFNDWTKEKLKNKGWYDEKDEPTKYFDKDGNEIAAKDAPAYYKRELTILEAKKRLEAKKSLYEGNFDLGEWGNLDVTAGQAEAHAGISAGLYRIGADGEKKFSPGVNAEIGTSVTAFEAGWENQLLGNEDLGLNADAGVVAGKAEAKADVKAQIFGNDGKLNIQGGAGVKAEAIAGEASGAVGMNIIGGEVGVKGSVNFGIGAHADVGLRDGVFKVDIGASVGVGASVGMEIDVGGMVDTVCDTAKVAWNGIEKGWDTLANWW